MLFKANLVKLVALVQSFSLRGVSCHWSLMGQRLCLAQESVTAGACAVPQLGSAAGGSTGKKFAQCFRNWRRKVA